MTITTLAPIELLKAKRMPIGTISRGRKKIAEGKWVPVKKGTQKKPDLTYSLKSVVKKAEDSIRRLDHEECYVFDAAGKQLLTKSGAKDSIEFSPDELAKMKEAKVFTHNHPSGGSFSPEDIKFAYFLDIKELRVASKKYDYSIKLGNVGRQATPWSVFSEIIDDSNRLTRRSNEKKISAGELSIKQAEAAHWHQVWEAVTEAVDGIEYQRTAGRKR